MGNYFRPRATLSLYLSLAGHISVKKAMRMLRKLAFAGRMWPAGRMLPPLGLHGAKLGENSQSGGLKKLGCFYNALQINTMTKHICHSSCIREYSRGFHYWDCSQSSQRRGFCSRDYRPPSPSPDCSFIISFLRILQCLLYLWERPRPRPRGGLEESVTREVL